MAQSGDESESAGPRVYGQADETDKQGGTDNGMRGERASDPDPEAGYTREETLETGRTVTIKEESGVAHVEAQGRQG